MTTGGRLLIEALARRGVEVIFGLPGVQLDGLFDAIAGQDAIRVIHTRDEQATTYMADGYARATGKVGVAAVVPGPGVLNAGAGLCTAYAGNSPVLLIAGQLFGGDLARGKGALHEIVDQSQVIEGTIGFTRRVRTMDTLESALDDAFARMNGPRRRPAAIEVGPEILTGKTDLAAGEPGSAPGLAPPDMSEIDRAASALVESRRPVIYAGGGSIQAGAGLQALSEALGGAPIVLTTQAKGAVDARNENVVPQVGGHVLLDEADAVVVVGSRFWTAYTPPRMNREATVVRIDSDEAMLAVREEGHLAVLADANAGAHALAVALNQVRPVDADAAAAQRARVAEVKTAVNNGLAEHFPELYGYALALRDVVSEEGILVDEMTQVGYMCREAYDTYAPRTHVSTGYQGTLGYGYPTALGAKVGQPGKPVLSINGDGGFLYNAGELATAVHHNIGVVGVVFADGAYGNVKRIQQNTYGREIASSFTNPDFVKLAEAFGMAGHRAHDADSLRRVLDTALATDKPALVEVPIGPQPDIWPIMSGRVRL